MRYLKILVLSIITYNVGTHTQVVRAVAQDGCTPPDWYQANIVEDEKTITTFASDGLLTNAINKAEDALWLRLYSQSSQGTQTSILASDFVADTQKPPSQVEVDMAIRNVYRWALVGHQKERKHSFVCNTYYVAVKLNTATIDKSLRNPKIIREYVYFVVEAKAHLVKEELNWQYFWRRHQLIPLDQIDKLRQSLILSKSLYQNKDDLSQQIAELLRTKHTKLESLYIKTFSSRSEAMFLKLRQELSASSRAFDWTYQAASSTQKGDAAGAQKHLLNLAQSGDTEAFFIVGTIFASLTQVEGHAETSFNWLLHAFSSGNQKAVPLLVNAYIQGKGTKMDYGAALALLEQGNINQNVENLLRSADILLSGGPNLTPNPERAVKYLESAAEFSDPRGAKQLGMIFLEGRHGIQKDWMIARSWFEKALAKGDASANEYLKVIKSEGQKSAQKMSAKAMLQPSEKAVSPPAKKPPEPSASAKKSSKPAKKP